MHSYNKKKIFFLHVTLPLICVSNINIKELESFFNAKGYGLALEKIKFNEYLVCI